MVFISKSSNLSIDNILHLHGIKFQVEHKFCTTRKWRFDFVVLPIELKIAIEVDGGNFTQGRHTRGTGYEKDCEKFNAAVVLGWRVFHYTPNMLKENPGQVIDDIRGVIR
jgi:very-short-patch-repair endonuclease